MVLLDGDVGRVVAEVATPSVTNVYIDRVAIAVQLPHSGNLHIIPALVVERGSVEVGGTLVGILHPVEAPCAVERETICALLVAICALGISHVLENLVGRVHRLAVNCIYVGILPLGKCLRLRADSGKQGCKNNGKSLHIKLFDGYQFMQSGA